MLLAGETDVNLLLQIAGFTFALLVTLPLIGLAGGALLRAGWYLSGVRMPGYWKAGLVFLVSSAFSGGAGFALIYLGSSLGSEIGPSSEVGAIIAFVISLPLQCVISAAAYVYFFPISWFKALTVWVWQ